MSQAELAYRVIPNPPLVLEIDVPIDELQWVVIGNIRATSVTGGFR